MGSSTKLIVAMVSVAVLAVAFWMLALSPKREEAKKLSSQVTQARDSLAQHRAEVAVAVAARSEFPVDYQQLVVLGKAVPGDDDTASFIVQLNRIAHRAKVRFQTFVLAGSGGGETAEAPVAGEAGGVPASPTEVAASTLPLGATIGPAGLAVMPYTLSFEGGDFFHMADFIKGLDSLVKTESANVTVDGRLITIDGFSLAADGNLGYPTLEATFEITTYLTPPSEGVTAGATPASPPATEATPAASTTGGAP